MDWEAMAERWGTTFPADYVAFMAEYGAGSISESCAVLRPKPPFPGLESDVEEETANARDGWPGVGTLAAVQGAKAPVIAWGVTVAGDIACWNTTAENPDDWTVAVFRASGLQPWREYGYGMVEFLRLAFTGALDECPFDDSTLWNRSPQSFVHWREQLRLLGVDEPWAADQ
ncbi:SMI1/KNR4 family protein [Streptomyces sp. H34-S4]|uniref:SMI1/KNR4 family protein n=1 Tax=Streptomyces sp. H34-S4 TaxID=2996463 RepID=UPI00226DF637|nr:SMI1/KNR4 family protein [Streptomyces sp. H34-S4]MCY0939520.1 SMI1/KNR4 family protein [Streptomyces sp. H34-S4]